MVFQDDYGRNFSGLLIFLIEILLGFTGANLNP